MHQLCMSSDVNGLNRLNIFTSRKRRLISRVKSQANRQDKAVVHYFYLEANVYDTIHKAMNHDTPVITIDVTRLNRLNTFTSRNSQLISSANSDSNRQENSMCQKQFLRPKSFNCPLMTHLSILPVFGHAVVSLLPLSSRHHHILEFALQVRIKHTFLNTT